MTFPKPILMAVTALGLTLGASGPAATAAERRPLVIAGGEVTGYYYPVAGALCRVINKERPAGMTCAVMPTAGSAANLAALRAGEADLALVQSRAALLAERGQEGFKEAGPMPDLRALMALHGEIAVVVARAGSGIEQLADLKGKRVNLGRPGSFQRAMAETVLEAGGLSPGDPSVLVELDFADQAGELCQGNIDAAMFTGVHPMPEVQLVIEECGATLVPIRARSLDTYLKRNPAVSHFTIKGGTYDGQSQDIPAIGLRTLLVGSRLSETEVAELMRAIWGNFGALTHLHPALSGLSRAEAAGKDGLAIPLHPGADAAARGVDR